MPTRTDPDEVYAEARTWFESHWSPAGALGEWWPRLADSGWGFPKWPERGFGKGLSRPAAKAVHRARMDVGAFSAPSGIATMVVAPTLIGVGAPQQQERFMIEVARMSAGTLPPSAGKRAAVRLVRAMRDTAFWLLGPGGTLTGDDAPLEGRVADMALMTPGMSIAGGTDEIQRNILGERHLGLPPEPRVDKDVTFRELRQGTVRG